MKKTLLLGASLLCSVFIMATEIPFQKAEIKSIMRKVADWQIANPHPALEHDDLNWPQGALYVLSLIHISEPTRQAEISYAVFCLKKKKKKTH